ESGNKLGLSLKQMQHVAQLIRGAGSRQACLWSAEDIWKTDNELSERLFHMTVHRLPDYEKIDVMIPLSRHARPDGVWLSEAITEKAGRYGLETVKNVGLVIGALGLVTPSSTKAFQAIHKADDLPFAEIWLVSPFDGVTCLKRSSMQP